MQSPSEFIVNYVSIGEKKSKANVSTLLQLAILAGFLIGMGGAVSSTVSHALGNVSAARIASGLLFPFGLIAIVLTGAELFTGNCMIIMSVWERRATFKGMLRNLALVYGGNLVGAFLLAASVVYSGQLDLSGGNLAIYTIRVAAAKCAIPFGHAVLLGVLCNVLVCAGVMCALCGSDVAGRAIGAFVPVCFFVVCGFEHCVANMYYIPAGLLALAVPKYAQLAVAAGFNLDSLTWSAFFLNNLLPVTIGNLLGGCGFALLIWSAHHKHYLNDRVGAMRQVPTDGKSPPDEGATSRRCNRIHCR